MSAGSAGLIAPTHTSFRSTNEFVTPSANTIQFPTTPPEPPNVPANGASGAWVHESPTGS
jgi:hypothetical protein